MIRQRQEFIKSKFGRLDIFLVNNAEFWAKCPQQASNSSIPKFEKALRNQFLWCSYRQLTIVIGLVTQSGLASPRICE